MAQGRRGAGWPAGTIQLLAAAPERRPKPWLREDIDFLAGHSSAVGSSRVANELDRPPLSGVTIRHRPVRSYRQNWLGIAEVHEELPFGPSRSAILGVLPCGAAGGDRRRRPGRAPGRREIVATWQNEKVTYGVQGDGTTVLVVDDHRAFAEAVTLAVEVEPGLRALGVATTAEEALRSFETAPPDVALVDIALPDVNGLELTAQIKKHYPSTRVVVITGSESPARLALAADAGADDVMSKSVRLTDLLAALADPSDRLLASERDLSAAIQEVAAGQPSAGGPELTTREQEVLKLLAEGRPPKRIARDLQISINTCRTHIRSILDKLDVHSQLAAVVQAARLGVLPGEPE
jgi:DNA-binding NarL/FixJ family response regulator